jgi:hypothetical protein
MIRRFTLFPVSHPADLQSSRANVAVRSSVNISVAIPNQGACSEGRLSGLRRKSLLYFSARHPTSAAHTHRQDSVTSNSGQTFLSFGQSVLSSTLPRTSDDLHLAFHQTFQHERLSKLYAVMHTLISFNPDSVGMQELLCTPICKYVRVMCAAKNLECSTHT